MLPILRLGELALPTYPLLLLVAYWLGMTLAASRAKQLNFDSDHIYNAGLYGLIAGILGARIWFVLSHWENYAPDITQAFSLSRSALSAGEGLIIAALVVLIYLQRNKVPLGDFVDAATPGIALALIIGNVGALLGGIALGAATALPWAIDVSGTSRHPIQFYEVGGLLIFLIFLYSKRQLRPWAGFQFWLFVAVYGLIRLFFEAFRARPWLVGNGYLAIQLLALAAIIVALAVMAYKFREDTPQADVIQSE
ncbi:MAG: prolipoprotein diacylglyceryl transferase family protein [Chloroflexota bacterium]